MIHPSRTADQRLSKRPRTTRVAGSTSAIDLCEDPSEADERSARRSFNRSLNDELVLLIFSWLSARDLCNSQLVNRHWARLAQDQQLWKALYLRQHGRERLRGSRGVYATAPEDEPAELGGGPGLSSTSSNRTVAKDWKYMFRVSSNWSSGRCVVDNLSHAVTPLPTSLLPTEDTVQRLQVVLADGLSFTASPNSSLVTAHYGQSVAHISSSRHLAPDVHVTAITVDQSRNKPIDEVTSSDLRLVTFYSDQSFSVFSVPLDDLATACEVVSFTPARAAIESAGITHAAYHHPLLITLSGNFTLSMFVIQDAGPAISVQRSQTLKSFTSFPPSSMVLSARSLAGPRAGQVAYRLTLSYAIPIYPSHWSVGVTDLNIVRRGTDYSVEHAQSVKASSSRLPATPAIPKTAGLSAAQLKRRTSAPIVPEAHATAEESIPPPRTTSPPVTIGYSETDDAELQRNRQQMALEREQWTRKVARVVATETDGRWVVLAGEQDGAALQVYRLSSRAGRLVFVRHLFGHRGVVAALAVADGRCVSLGAAGEVWAWDLETGIGVEVDGTGEVDNGVSDAPCTVAFDEMRVITGSAGCLRVRRFDL